MPKNKRMVPAGVLQRIATVHAQQESEQMTFLRRENERLVAENRGLRDRSGFLKELIENIRGSLQIAEPLPPIAFKYPGKRTDSDVAVVIKLSDFHIGEHIDPLETDNFGQYNWKIAKVRAQYIAEKFIDWVTVNRQAFRIPKLYILGEGDWISGDIHEELRRTNEFPIPVQSVKAGQLLAQMVASFAPHFPEIHLIEVGADNHGRLQPRPQFKQKAQNNMSYVVYALANEILARHKNVEINFVQGIKTLIDINGQKFLTEHGDTVQAWMGIPYYGLERARGREAVRRMQTDIGFDYMSIAHWHVPGIVSGNILINGSLSGTSEFDHGCGRHSDPAQVSFLVHPKYGVYNWVAWKPKR